MESSQQNRIAAISMARNDALFITKWVNYYGEQFGLHNLYLILDGHDQQLPPQHESINVLRLPHIKYSRAKGDRNRARLISFLAKSLFHRYDSVIAHDIDEFLVVDPNQDKSLADYLRLKTKSNSLSALGLDVGQHIEEEQPIDPARPFLSQRSYAHVSSRYTKPVVANRPLTWGSGFHRVKWQNFRIDSNLYLFHFGMVDFNRSREKIGDISLLKAGWEGHLDRRLKLFDLIAKTSAQDGDSFFKKARLRQSIFRPIYALNKPGMLSEAPIVKIPERFRMIV